MGQLCSCSSHASNGHASVSEAEIGSPPEHEVLTLIPYESKDARPLAEERSLLRRPPASRLKRVEERCKASAPTEDEQMTAALAASLAEFQRQQAAAKGKATEQPSATALTEVLHTQKLLTPLSFKSLGITPIFADTGHKLSTKWQLSPTDFGSDADILRRDPTLTFSQYATKSQDPIAQATECVYPSD